MVDFHHRSSVKPNKAYKGISKRKIRRNTLRSLSVLNSRSTSKARILSRSEKLNKSSQIKKSKLKKIANFKNNFSRVPKFCVILDIENIDQILKNEKLTFLKSINNPVLNLTTKTVKNFASKKGVKINLIKPSPNLSFFGLLDLIKISDFFFFKSNTDFLAKQNNFKNCENNKNIKNCDFKDSELDFSKSEHSEPLAKALKIILAQGAVECSVFVDSPNLVDKTALKKYSKSLSIFIGERLNRKIKIFNGNNFERILSQILEKKPPRIAWRDERCYLMAQAVKSIQTSSGPLLEIIGCLRGQSPLSVNSKMHVTGKGDFSLKRVDLLSETISSEKNSTKNGVLTENLINLDFLGPLEENCFSVLKTIEATENGIEKEDIVMGEEEKNILTESIDYLNIDPSEFEKKNFEIKRIKFDFEQEVETPTDKPARLRFRKYHGLQNFRRSPWPDKSVPIYYGKLHSFSNYKQQRKAILEKKLQNGLPNEKSADRIEPQQFVRLYLDCPQAAQIAAEWKQTREPLIVSSLLLFEDKQSIVHFNLKKSSETQLESKKEVYFHSGFRRFLAAPIYSTGGAGCDKYLLEKNAPESFCSASLVGNISMSHQPLFVTPKYSEAKILAEGEFDTVDTNRILIKKIILTGYPVKCKKNKAVVRYMFFSARDVKWYSSVEVRTKRGLVGSIKESVGDHGNMKCVFSDYIKNDDIVCLPLYKRVFPKPFNF